MEILTILMETPLISIALCTYNGQQFLKEQLESLINQTYKHIEIIAVDDCSNDSTFEVLQEYAAIYSNIQVRQNKSRLGHNLNFQQALSACNGELIAICDQDDIWTNDKLERQREAMKNNVLVYCDSHFIDYWGNSMKYKMSDKFNFVRGSRPEAFLFSNCVSGHSILMRKSVLSVAMPFPLQFHYDQWLAFAACCMGSIDFVEEGLLQYRIHDNNCTDILARQHNKRKPNATSILQDESKWLQICAEIQSSSQQLISTLYYQSLKRNDSYFCLSFGHLIWRNRTTLLSISKKNNVSKFFFVLRKIWGGRIKRNF